jgi:catechol 2,3-dioxygenase-like lactoylglutathione lyase family enzyme
MVRGMSIRNIQLFSIPVTDQDRARDFYVGVLGFELVREMPMGPGRRWVQLRPPGAETSVTLVTWFESMPAGSLTGVVLETDDLEGDLARLRDRGAVTDDQIADQPWGRSVGFADPDGNRLILQATTFRP